jgi:hypothetical protein
MLSSQQGDRERGALPAWTPAILAWVRASAGVAEEDLVLRDLMGGMAQLAGLVGMASGHALRQRAQQRGVDYETGTLSGPAFKRVRLYASVRPEIRQNF